MAAFARPEGFVANGSPRIALKPAPLATS